MGQVELKKEAKMLNNIQTFFSVLVLIFSIGMFLTVFKEKKGLIDLFIATVLSLVLINLNFWYLTGLGITLILYPLINQKMAHNDIVTYSMTGSILTSYFVLILYQTYTLPLLKIIIAFTLIIMCLLSVLGIFEKNIKKFFIYSNLIQFLFVLLDLSIAKLTGKIGALGIIQIFNYTIAGSLFFLTLLILNKDKVNLFSEIQGHYYKDHTTGILAIIACVSLAGLPGLNIFVSEWLLFVKAFTIDPAITIIGIFIALLLFIMYFKVIYILISKYQTQKSKTNKISRSYAIILGILCLLFGILFNLQFYILNWVLQ